jgi:hypothetical protein
MSRNRNWARHIYTEIEAHAQDQLTRVWASLVLLLSQRFVVVLVYIQWNGHFLVPCARNRGTLFGADRDLVIVADDGC